MSFVYKNSRHIFAGDFFCGIVLESRSVSLTPALLVSVDFTSPTPLANPLFAVLLLRMGAVEPWTVMVVIWPDFILN
jgi:hypothetical protein